MQNNKQNTVEEFNLKNACPNMNGAVVFGVALGDPGAKRQTPP
jgi:hypothetical protein